MKGRKTIMPFRYVCPHCQGSGNQYGLRLLSFIKCRICSGDGHIFVSINENTDVEKDSENTKQSAEKELESTK